MAASSFPAALILDGWDTGRVPRTDHGERHASGHRRARWFISALKLAERHLLENEAHLIEAQRIAGISSWELDISSGARKWSEQTCRIFEVERATFRPTFQAFLEFVHPDVRKPFLIAQEAALAGSSRLQQMDARRSRSRSTAAEISTSCSPTS